MRSGLAVISGGMDSAVLLYMMKGLFDDLHAISFKYGQRHVKELDYAMALTKQIGTHHEVVDISDVGRILDSALTSDTPVPDGHYTDESMKVTVVPNRNMIMISIAAAYAISRKIETVGLAVHQGDHAIYPDCRPEFVAAAQGTLRMGNYSEVKLYTPFLRRTKTDIAKIGVSLGVDLVNQTWSCYKGGEVHCGTCGTCVERFEALRGAGLRA